MSAFDIKGTDGWFVMVVALCPFMWLVMFFRATRTVKNRRVLLLRSFNNQLFKRLTLSRQNYLNMRQKKCIDFESRL